VKSEGLGLFLIFWFEERLKKKKKEFFLAILKKIQTQIWG
jgi:hypothetical protein